MQQTIVFSLFNQMRDIKLKVYMCVNKIKLKTAYKNNHLSIIYIFKITYYDDGTPFLAILGHLLLIIVVWNDY